jgi:predicted dehydrogenase
MKNTNKPVRWASVGTSRIADMFAQGAQDVPACKLSAVCSRNPETGRAFSQRHGGGLEIFEDLAQLAASDDIDAAYIATPNSLHYEQNKLLLEHGKHVLCEKPATVLPGQLEQLQRIAEENGVVYLEAMLMMHQPQRAALHSALKGIGRIREAHLCYSQLSSRYGALLKGEVPNIFNPELAGGALLDLGVYCVNAAVDLFGVPETIDAHAVFMDSGADASGAAMLEYKDKIVTLSYSKTGRGVAPSEIIGDSGTVTVDMISMYGGIKLYQDEQTSELSGAADHIKALGQEARDFCGYITDQEFRNSEYPVMTRQMRDSSKLLHQIRKESGIRFPFEDEP